MATTTMTVEQGKCQIYPSAQEQLCMRVRVIVVPLKPVSTPGGEWVADDTDLHTVDVRCSQRGLERLLKGIGNATKPPTKRGLKPDA